MSLVLVHARYRILETTRVPIALIGTVAFPALFMLLFVVSNRTVAGDPVFATTATAQMSFFAVVSAYAFNLGAGVAEDRAQPWQVFLRSLPAGPAAELGGRLINATVFGLLGTIPVGLTAALFTEASANLGQVVGALLGLLVGGVPFVFLGLAIGYALPLKAAVPVVQLVLFPMAFAGGLFLPPQMFPGWLDTLSHALPTRAGRDLVVGALTSTPIPASALVVTLAWTIVVGGLAVWARNRDEGRRFR